GPLGSRDQWRADRGGCVVVCLYRDPARLPYRRAFAHPHVACAAPPGRKRALGPTRRYPLIAHRWGAILFRERTERRLSRSPRSSSDDEPSHCIMAPWSRPPSGGTPCAESTHRQRRRKRGPNRTRLVVGLGPRAEKCSEENADDLTRRRWPVGRACSRAVLP